jgi:hypothetical protein
MDLCAKWPGIHSSDIAPQMISTMFSSSPSTPGRAGPGFMMVSPTSIERICVTTDLMTLDGIGQTPIETGADGGRVFINCVMTAC